MKSPSVISALNRTTGTTFSAASGCKQDSRVAGNAHFMGFFQCRFKKVTQLYLCYILFPPVTFFHHTGTENFKEERKKRMLRLSVKDEEFLMIGEDIKIVFVGHGGGYTRIMIDAPREVNIVRSKALEKKLNDPALRRRFLNIIRKRNIPKNMSTRTKNTPVR